MSQKTTSKKKTKKNSMYCWGTDVHYLPRAHIEHCGRKVPCKRHPNAGGYTQDYVNDLEKWITKFPIAKKACKWWEDYIGKHFDDPRKTCPQCKRRNRK